MEASTLTPLSARVSVFEALRAGTQRKCMIPGRVLLADPDGEVAASLANRLGERNIVLRHCSSAEQAVRALAGEPFDAAMVALDLPDGGGIELLRALASRWPDVRVIALADDAASPAAVEATRLGATDFVPRPLDFTQLAHVIDKAIDEARSEPDPAPLGVDNPLIGQSRAMQQVLELVERAAASAATVLIRGESGTGKELVARALHAKSPRSAQPFVKIHCAALPDTLLESELFGYEKGAFTGATQRKPGRVELAQRGTLFLDEIGDITPLLQVKLLRLLQDKEFERLGGGAVHKADVRFVMATHRDLDALVKSGEFREDLFYRINVVTIWLPPLRARRDDVVSLAKHFAENFARAHGKGALQLSDEALEHLRRQRWPGNVRQLQNFVERLVALSAGPELTLADVQRELRGSVAFATQATGAATLDAARRSDPERPVLPLSDEVRSAERAALVHALEHTQGNRALAARLLGVSRATLYNKLAEHGLS